MGCWYRKQWLWTHCTTMLALGKWFSKSLVKKMFQQGGSNQMLLTKNDEQLRIVIGESNKHFHCRGVLGLWIAVSLPGKWWKSPLLGSFGSSPKPLVWLLGIGLLQKVLTWNVSWLWMNTSRDLASCRPNINKHMRNGFPSKICVCFLWRITSDLSCLSNSLWCKIQSLGVWIRHE